MKTVLKTCTSSKVHKRSVKTTLILKAVNQPVVNVELTTDGTPILSTDGQQIEVI